MKLCLKEESGLGFDAIYRPTDEEKHPGIFILHGSEGGFSGWSDMAGVFWAAHGFITYIHRYSTGGNTYRAGNIIAIPIESVVEAFTHFSTLDCVKKPLAIMGTSRGAELALLMASFMAIDGIRPLPEGVVSIAGSDVIVAGFAAANWWPTDEKQEPFDPSLRAWTWKNSSENLLPTLPIPIEKYPGNLLLIHGKEDEVWNWRLSQRLEQRRRKAGMPVTTCFVEGGRHFLSGACAEEANAAILDFLLRL